MKNGINTSKNVNGSRSSLEGCRKANAELRQKIRELEDMLETLRKKLPGTESCPPEGQNA